jgi:hypothetical protein
MECPGTFCYSIEQMGIEILGTAKTEIMKCPSHNQMSALKKIQNREEICLNNKILILGSCLSSLSNHF